MNKHLFIAFVICAALFEFTEAGKKITLPLYRQKSPREQMLNAPNLEEYGVYLNWLKTNSAHNISIALYRFLDSEFYTKIVVGKPGKTFNVVVDTTWTYSWLMSSDCKSNVIGCWFHNKYNHKHSSTWKKDGRKFSMNEGSYNFTGYFSNDTISIGQALINQSFIEMTSLSYWYLFGKSDGLMGLGLKFGEYNPFIYAILEKGNISKSMFSIYMNRDKQSNHGGNVILGAIESRHIHSTNKVKDKITYLPVKSYAFWQFDIDKVVAVVGKKSVPICEKGCTGLADSSNSLIIGPKKYVDIINDLIDADVVPFFGRFSVKCDTVMKLPPITFVLGGNNFTLTGKQYTQKLSVSSFTLCISAFTYSDAPSEQEVWVLGAAFLSEYYSIYDIESKQMGFVKAA